MSGGFKKMRRLSTLRLIMRVRSETRALRWAVQMREWQTFGTSANVPVNFSRLIRASRRRVYLRTDSSQSAGGRATSEGVDCSTLFPDPIQLAGVRGSLKPNVHYFFTLRKVKWGQSINMSYSHYLVCWKHPGRHTQSLWDSLAIINHISKTYYSFGLGQWKILVLGLKLCHKDSSAAHVCSCTKYPIYAVQGSQNFKIPGSPSGRYSSDFGSPKLI